MGSALHSSSPIKAAPGTLAGKGGSWHGGRTLAAAAPTPPGGQPLSQALHILLLLGQLEHHLGKPAERGGVQQGIGAGQAQPAAGEGRINGACGNATGCRQAWDTPAECPSRRPLRLPVLRGQQRRDASQHVVWQP